MSNTNQPMNAKNISTVGAYNLEEMIAYIRQNPNAALDIHQHLTQVTYLHHLNPPTESSTPKRDLDASDNDNAQVSKQQRVLSNGKQKNTRQMNVSIASNVAHRSSNNHINLLGQPQQQTSEQQYRRLPFEQLKRAVSSNLPCFFIEYDQAHNPKNRPSDVSAASLIEDHFKQQGISVTFSLVGHTGNKLKLGVNNKESYSTLISTDKWPLQIKNINITVIKPNFIPDSFALVARYVPLQYDDEYVKDEIERNLQSAENVRRIQYRFQRRTNDFRFIVKDLREYNTLLKLGRISIGNSFCTITPFLAGNRMTYCSRCWCLGHMRDKMRDETSRCRVCLCNLIDGQAHECSNMIRCAQCDGSHHSLSSECGKVVEYRADLKEQVNNAISTGKLQRLVPQDNVQPTQPQMKQNEFYSLPPLMPRVTPWSQAPPQPSATTNMNGNEDTTKMLSLINQNVLDMKENTHRMDEKLDCINGKVDQTTLDTELHHETLGKVLSTLSSLIADFMWPVTRNDKLPQLQILYDTLKTVSSHLKSDYTSRRIRSTSPPLRLSPSQPPNATDNTPNTETDQNMSK